MKNDRAKPEVVVVVSRGIQVGPRRPCCGQSRKIGNCTCGAEVWCHSDRLPGMRPCCLRCAAGLVGVDAGEIQHIH